MKKLMLILCVAVMGVAVNAQEAQAKIEFKTDVIDYGEIAKGADGVRQFEFTNTGKAPLVISRVQSSCGCTIPKKPKDPIAPGESGVIEVKYDTKRIGPFRKTISVYSNASEMPTPIKIKGTIQDNSKSVLEKK
ncbi:DUF1573 domain-containing protein [Aquimarina sp. ERC-38]|uniref:DUF1573 domain-containing protein n=1 Tax=Aquimarina sp. ERC-38 TaxID=2949996 RepID=UPI0022458FEF|nr:DUF1573 domain-containing protein [Aquimarina sp. ERC-38]UZO80569.1 DUF1573 domain-containing protein [Aquimarina sp. ERC-38]